MKKLKLEIRNYRFVEIETSFIIVGFRYFAIYFSLAGFTTCALIFNIMVFGCVLDTTTMFFD